MTLVIQIFHIAIAITLVALILLQSSKGGLGSTFGGGEAYRTRRGTERVVFLLTITMCVLFLITSIGTLFLQP